MPTNAKFSQDAATPSSVASSGTCAPFHSVQRVTKSNSFWLTALSPEVTVLLRTSKQRLVEIPIIVPSSMDSPSSQVQPLASPHVGMVLAPELSGLEAVPPPIMSIIVSPLNNAIVLSPPKEREPPPVLLLVVTSIHFPSGYDSVTHSMIATSRLSLTFLV